MNEITTLVMALKKCLKEQHITYRDLAKSLDVSEPSIKRIFASQAFTLERVVQICDVLGITLTELVSIASTLKPKIRTLTWAQEESLVTDMKLLVTAVCILNQWSMADII